MNPTRDPRIELSVEDMPRNGIHKIIVFMGGTELCKDRIANAYVNDTSEGVVKADKREWRLAFHHWTIRFPKPNTNSEIYGFRTSNDVLYNAHGIVLLYYVSSRNSFDDMIHYVYKQICKIRRPLDSDGPVTRRVGCVLVGLNFDQGYKEREVSKDAAREWAQTQGIECFELDSYAQESVGEVMKALLDSMIRAKQRNAEDLAQRAPASSFDDILGRLPAYD